MALNLAKHKEGGLYALFYGAQFVLLGIQLPFFAGWLALNDFSAFEIGLITGLSLILRLLLGPAIAFWADHQSDERLPLRIASLVFAVGGVALLYAPGKIFIGAAAAMIIFVFGLLVPLTDTAVLRADRNGRLHYGQTRAAGSIFFLVTTIIGGAALTAIGVGKTAAVMALAAAATFMMSLLLPAGAGGRGGVKPVSWREAPKLLGNRVFLIVLFAAGLTQGAHAVYYAFSFLRWDEIGYSTFTIGCLWATGVIVEIVVLARARGLARRFGPATLLLIGAGGASFRWTVTAFEPPLAVLFAVQLLHACTFAATYLGSIEFLDRAAPLRLINTGMTLMSTTGVGALTGLATVIAGGVWQQFGPFAAYSMMALMGTAAAALSLTLTRQWDGGKLFE